MMSFGGAVVGPKVIMPRHSSETSNPMLPSLGCLIGCFPGKSSTKGHEESRRFSRSYSRAASCPFVDCFPGSALTYLSEQPKERRSRRCRFLPQPFAGPSQPLFHPPPDRRVDQVVKERVSHRRDEQRQQQAQA